MSSPQNEMKIVIPRSKIKKKATRDDFNTKPVVWPQDEPYEILENDEEHRFACTRGNETFILGDTIEILDDELVHVCEIEKMYELNKKKFMVVRWHYSWRDIYENVKEFPDFVASIPEHKLDPQNPEVFYTELTDVAALNVPMRKCFLLPKSEYESHIRLGEHSPYIGRPVYSILGNYNADTNKFSRLKPKSLHYEVLNNRFYMVVYLVSVLGADVNERNEKNATPLQHAANYGNVDLLRFLLANGANVNVKNNEGFTPMHWAANEGYTATDSLEPIRLLYEAGADILPRDLEGRTPLDWAKTEGLREVKKYIESILLKEKERKEQQTHIDEQDDLELAEPTDKDYESIPSFDDDDSPLSALIRSSSSSLSSSTSSFFPPTSPILEEPTLFSSPFSRPASPFSQPLDSLFGGLPSPTSPSPPPSPPPSVPSPLPTPTPRTTPSITIPSIAVTPKVSPSLPPPLPTPPPPTTPSIAVTPKVSASTKKSQQLIDDLFRSPPFASPSHKTTSNNITSKPPPLPISSQKTPTIVSKDKTPIISKDKTPVPPPITPTISKEKPPAPSSPTISPLVPPKPDEMMAYKTMPQRTKPFPSGRVYDVPNTVQNVFISLDTLGLPKQKPKHIPSSISPSSTPISSPAPISSTHTPTVAPIPKRKSATSTLSEPIPKKPTPKSTTTSVSSHPSVISKAPHKPTPSVSKPVSRSVSNPSPSVSSKPTITPSSISPPARKFTPTPLPELKKTLPKTALSLQEMKIPKISARPPIPNTDPPVVKTHAGDKKEGTGLKRTSILGKRGERADEAKEGDRKKVKSKGSDDEMDDTLSIAQVGAEEHYIPNLSLKKQFASSVAIGLLLEVQKETQEFKAIDQFVVRSGRIQRRDTRYELERAWKINNPTLERTVMDTARKMQVGGYVRVFHGTNVKSFLSIAKEGFRLPDSLMNNDGKGPLFFGRMIYFAVEPGNSLYYSGHHTYSVIADVYHGRCWKHEKRMTHLEPDELRKYNFDSIYSETVSTRGKIWAIPDPRQIIPRYLIKFRKLQQDSLYTTIQNVKHLPQRDFSDMPPVDVRKISGLVHMNEDFATIWDLRPSFRVHCLIVYRHKFSVPPYTKDVIPILKKMDNYIGELVKKFARAHKGCEFKYGLILNPTQNQLHCHFYSPNKKSSKQARNVLFKKFLPPVIKTPKQVISIIERYGSYDGTDDVAPALEHITSGVTPKTKSNNTLPPFLSSAPLPPSSSNTFPSAPLN